MNCGDCASPNAWCQEMPEICDDSNCQYIIINYMGCDSDCVDRTVLEGGDDYPVGTLSSAPLCVITDDMTCQEKIEALSGAIYDYDDVIDNQLGYFYYDDPYDYEEWCAWDDPGKVERVVIPTDWMLLMAGLSSPGFDQVSGQTVW